MEYIKLQNLIPDFDKIEAYEAFRLIEDWCLDSVPRDKWRFDYSSTLCVCGVDIPARIFFWMKQDAIAFKLRFKVCDPTQSSS